MFRLDPEAAHSLALAALSLLPPARTSGDPPELGQKLWNLEFANPLGLAAGMDKDARAVGTWTLMGFGFAELGTVTPAPQSGDPRPRLWRLSAQQALVNRLGFPSAGMEAVARKLARLRARGVGIRLGLSVGPNKTTPREQVARDYQVLIGRLAPLADFVVLNLSSPNTPGLREFQTAQEMRGLLDAVIQAGAAALRRSPVAVPLAAAQTIEALHPGAPAGPGAQAAATSKPGAVAVPDSDREGACPILVKLGPDLEQRALESACGLLLELGIDGVVACNTTTARDAIELQTAPEGGLSGQPLKLRARGVIRAIYRRTQGQLPIVGVGGIGSAADAYDHIRAGASLIELYTALVFEGPGLIARIKLELTRMLRRDGFKTLAQAVGTQS